MQGKTMNARKQLHVASNMLMRDISVEQSRNKLIFKLT